MNKHVLTVPKPIFSKIESIDHFMNVGLDEFSCESVGPNTIEMVHIAFMQTLKRFSNIIDHVNATIHITSNKTCHCYCNM